MNEKNLERLKIIEKVLNKNLPCTVDGLWLRNAFPALPEDVKAEHAQSLTAPCADLMRRGGKRWRPLLLTAACVLAGGEEEKAYSLVPIVELVHTASLIHDDIEDNADKRRGGGTIHLVYGLDIAVNAGSWLYFYALNAINRTNFEAPVKLLLYKICTENLNRLHLGQAMDIGWHKENFFFPSRSQYESMIRLKTGSLSRLAGELGFIAAGKTEDEACSFGEIMADIGAGFQILDDVKNIENGNAGKLRGDDIVEGKKSFPVILYAEKSGRNAEEIMELLQKAKQEGISSATVKESITLMERAGVLKEARRFGERTIENAVCKLKAAYPKAEEEQPIFNLFSFLMKTQSTTAPQSKSGCY